MVMDLAVQHPDFLDICKEMPVPNSGLNYGQVAASPTLIRQHLPIMVSLLDMLTPWPVLFVNSKTSSPEEGDADWHVLEHVDFQGGLKRLEHPLHRPCPANWPRQVIMRDPNCERPEPPAAEVWKHVRSSATSRLLRREVALASSTLVVYISRRAASQR